MNLFEDEELFKPKKKKAQVKPTTIIAIAIVALLILLVIIVASIIYLKSTILTITLDGKNVNDLESVLIFEENDKIYMPIKKMAEYLGYSAYNGDYITRSEDDTTKCYIESSEEIVCFTLSSNVITKVVDGQTQQIKISEPVKEINGELCIEANGTEDAFNIKFYYTASKNKIIIQTLGYLYTAYSNYAVSKGYVEIEDESFANKTAVLDNMLIVKTTNNYYGVISTQNENEIILETKYDSIEYFRKNSEFLVGNNNKKGIITKDRKTKIEMSYDSIEKVTNKNDVFYIVGKSGLYGLLDSNGERIIYTEYEQIGINVSAYQENGVTNGYILYNQLIPVKLNNKWALFNIDGNAVTDFIYDSFGCTTAKNAVSRTYAVIEVLDYNLIVARQGDKYNLITVEGKRLFDNSILDSVYITISNGKKIYYITNGETTKELISFLQENGYSKPTQIEL